MTRAREPRGKSRKKDDRPGWYKFAFVGLAIIFAVAMVGSYMYPLFTSSQTAEIGNMAVFGYTIYDSGNRPIITTEEDVYMQAAQNNQTVFLTRALEMPVGVAFSEGNITSVPIVTQQGQGSYTFGLLGYELNAISQSMIGQAPGTIGAIPLRYGGNALAINMSSEEFEGMTGFNFSSVRSGDRIPVGMAAQPTLNPDGTEEVTYPLRVARVTEKGNESLILQYGYGSVEVTLREIGG